MNTVPGVDMSTGSLGQGHVRRLRHGAGRQVPEARTIGVYSLLGDGEIAGGPGLGGHRCLPPTINLDNLCVIVDN